VNATQQYDAFGNFASSTGTWQGQFGYGGGFGYQQDATGLKLLGHRYYDSSTGRFLTRDPIKDGRNWYSYVGNDPIKWSDPSGLILPAIAAVAAIALIVWDVVDAGFSIKEIIDNRHDPNKWIPSTVLLLAGFVDPTPGNVSKHAGKRFFRIVDTELGKETTERLARDAANAAAAEGFGHGVSVSVKARANRTQISAFAEDIEKVFEIRKTGAGKHHYTIILPNPVTDDVTKQFNDIFK